MTSSVPPPPPPPPFASSPSSSSDSFPPRPPLLSLPRQPSVALGGTRRRRTTDDGRWKTTATTTTWGPRGNFSGGRRVGRALRYTQLRKIRAKCCLLPLACTHKYITTHRYTHTCLPLGAVVDSSKPSWGRSGPTGVAWTAVEGRSRECAWVVGHKPHGRITWSLWQYFGASGAPRGTVPGVLGSIQRPSKSIGSEKASSSNMYGFHNF